MKEIKIWDLINDLCDRRNKNPLCHASCNIFNNKQDLTVSISKDIEEFNNLINLINLIISNYL